MKNKWVVLIASVILQTILGGVYAWSTFVPYLGEQFGINKGECGLIFGITIGLFTIAMIPAGRAIGRLAPRKIALTGAFLFMLGYVVASFCGGSYPLLLLGIGGISGVGIGLAYVCPLSVGLKWFPTHKGLITGLAVAGFGGGAIILSFAAEHYLKLGMPVDTLFGWMAIIYGGGALLAASALTNPDTGGSTKACAGSVSDKLKTLHFWYLIIGIFAGTFSGLLVIGNLASMVLADGLSRDEAAAIVAIFAVGNISGRLISGFIFDRLGYITVPVSLLLSAIVVSLFLLDLSFTGCAVAAISTGFLFGSNFVIYATVISTHYGEGLFPKLYPVCFLGYGFAGCVGPAVGGWIAEYSGSFTYSIYLCIIILALAAVVVSRGRKVYAKN